MCSQRISPLQHTFKLGSHGMILSSWQGAQVFTLRKAGHTVRSFPSLRGTWAVHTIRLSSSVVWRAEAWVFTLQNVSGLGVFALHDSRHQEV